MNNGFTIAITRYMDHHSVQLQHCEFVAASDSQMRPYLEALVKNHHLEDYDCHILLTPEQYRSISIDVPAVNHDELKQAAHWKVADLLEYPIDQTTIDFYKLPKSNRANTPELMEVIVSANETLSTLIERCQEAGLNIKVIDIQETALRNLATLLPENKQGVALLHLHKDNGRIIIQKNGSIYLSRKISCGYQQLANHESSYLEQDNLALEIQRSFDYVENYFDIPPINSLAIVLTPVNIQNVASFLATNYGITARAMDLSAIVDSNSLLSDATQNVCAPVIGASLRRHLETLSS